MRQLYVNWRWAAVLLLAMAFARSAQAQDAFAGGWQVHCTPYTSSTAAGADAFDDGFLFENGNFSAQAYCGLDFTPAAYTIDSTGKFTATLTSADRGTVVWTGRANAMSIYGHITWTKPDGTVFKYRFTGSAIAQDSGSSGGGSGGLGDGGIGSGGLGSGDSGSSDGTGN